MALMYKTINTYVREKDVNLSDNIRPSAILDLFQDIAGIHANELNIGYLDLLKENLYWIVLAWDIKVISRIPKFGEDIKVITWPKVAYRLEFEREFEIRDINNNLLIIGNSDWILMDSVKRKIERANRVEFKGEYYKSNNFSDKMNHRLNLEIDNIDLEYDYKVEVTDLDHNGHLNNARYLDIIYNMDINKAHKSIKSLKISFIHEAMYNEIIHVIHGIKDGFDLYLGYVKDELSFEVMVKLED